MAHHCTSHTRSFHQRLASLGWSKRASYTHNPEVSKPCHLRPNWLQKQMSKRAKDGGSSTRTGVTSERRAKVAAPPPPCPPLPLAVQRAVAASIIHESTNRTSVLPLPLAILASNSPRLCPAAYILLRISTGLSVVLLARGAVVLGCLCHSH